MSYQITKLLMVRSVPFKYRVTSFSCCSSFYLPLSSKLHQDQHHLFLLQTPCRSVSTTSPSWKAMKKTYPSLKEKYMKGQSKKGLAKTYEIWDTINVVDLAKILKVDPDEVFELILTIDESMVNDERQPIRSRSLLTEVSKKLRCKFKYIADPRKRSSNSSDEVDNLDVVHPPPRLEDLQPRPPVCAIVGHIDHGKTSLLDYLRKSSIVSMEYGGITQHIGAFSVALPTADGTSTQNVTFLDTPGHAAFKNMRIRGAHVTDIVILVVDASEGPLEQTLESIRAVKDARVSMIVAINKIDKPEANIEATKKALYEAGVQLEDYGGDVQAVPISALHGTNVKNLIEAILAQAEVLQLAADPHGPVEGTVIESEVEPGLGKTAVVLIRRGTLKKGDFLVCGQAYAKVRMLLNTGAVLEDEKAYRKELKEVRPSEACKVVGWKDLPHAGAEVLQVESEKRAHQVIQWRHEQEQAQKQIEDFIQIDRKREQDRKKYEELRMKKLETGMLKVRYGRFDFHVREKETLPDDGPPRVSFVVKADVDGSLDAIMGCLKTYHSNEVEMDILHVGVGSVTETDLKLAHEFGGIVYSFNAEFSDAVRRSASFLQVTVKEFNVIYALIDDLKNEISQKLPLADVEVPIGRGIVLKEFLISDKNKKVPVAGCRVSHGKFDKTKIFRIIRSGGTKVVYEGSVFSLRHLKDEVPQVNQGQECGIRFQDNSVRFDEKDEILCFEMTKEPRFTDWSPGF